MVSIRRRIELLEARDGPRENAFLWRTGVPLVEALAAHGLTLDDEPLRAIELVGVRPGPNGPEVVVDPVHERDRHLLG